VTVIERGSGLLIFVSICQNLKPSIESSRKWKSLQKMEVLLSRKAIEPVWSADRHRKWGEIMERYCANAWTNL
jgi:hypothetical protein